MFQLSSLGAGLLNSGIPKLFPYWMLLVRVRVCEQRLAWLEDTAFWGFVRFGRFVVFWFTPFFSSRGLCVPFDLKELPEAELQSPMWKPS